MVMCRRCCFKFGLGKSLAFGNVLTVRKVLGFIVPCTARWRGWCPCGWRAGGLFGMLQMRWSPLVCESGWRESAPPPTSLSFLGAWGLPRGMREAVDQETPCKFHLRIKGPVFCCNLHLGLLPSSCWRRSLGAGTPEKKKKERAWVSACATCLFAALPWPSGGGCVASEASVWKCERRCSWVGWMASCVMCSASWASDFIAFKIWAAMFQKKNFVRPLTLVEKAAEVIFHFETKT